MKSNQENSHGFLDRLKEGLSRIVQLSAAKHPLSRLSASLFGQRAKKIKILKERYRHSRLRESCHKERTRKDLLNYFHLPENLLKYFRLPENLKSAVHKLHFKDFKSLCFQLSKKLISVVHKLHFKGFKSLYFRLSEKLISAIHIPKFSLFQLSVTDSFRKYFSRKTAVGGIVFALVISLLIGANLKIDAYAVEVDGRKLAVTTEKASAEKLVLDLKAEKVNIWKRKVDMQQKLAYRPVKVKRYQVDNFIELKNILNKNLTFVAVATGIKVNGQVLVVVSDDKTAEEVLQQLKDSFKPDNANIEAVTFAEKVEIADVPVSLKEVVPAPQALQLLKEGRQKKVVHIVKQGDSLWTIARANDMHVADLLKVNTSIKGERLDLGQEINLVALEPMLSVVVTAQKTVEEILPYKTIVETDRNGWRGQQKIKTRGVNGSREVTYKLMMKNGSIVGKEVLDQKILKAATNQVVVRGSKVVVASRGGGGTLGWPISGRITSGYGRRWGQMHTGMDIDGYKGQPVGAAAAGVVVSAGRDGGYGKMVTLRHGNGLVTKYAHLSKIEVSVGQNVERGDLIGLVGSTGRSTGSHLHFEVISGGRFQNPMKYLK